MSWLVIQDINRYQWWKGVKAGPRERNILVVSFISRRSATYFSSLSFLSLLLSFLFLSFLFLSLYFSFLSLSLSFFLSMTFLFCRCICLFVTVCALSVSVTFIPQFLRHLRRLRPLSSSLPSRQPTPFGSSCIDFWFNNWSVYVLILVLRKEM